MIKIPTNMLSRSTHRNVWYLSIPKNACSSVKMSIFEEKFGFRFPEVPHPRRHGALIHIHHFYKTRRLNILDLKKLEKQDGRLLVILRDPLERFVSGYVEKVLLNVKNYNEFYNLTKLKNVEGQIANNDFENRIIRDHLRPQSFWLGDNLDMPCSLCTLDNLSNWLKLKVNVNKTKIVDSELLMLKEEAREFMANSSVFADIFESDKQLFNLASNNKELNGHG